MYTNDLGGSTDASGYLVLQFRAAVNFNDPRNPAGDPQDFTQGFSNTVRVPLAAFSGVDLTDVRRVTFNFDQTPTGALRVTDLTFAFYARGYGSFHLCRPVAGGCRLFPSGSPASTFYFMCL